MYLTTIISSTCISILMLPWFLGYRLFHDQFPNVIHIISNYDIQFIVCFSVSQYTNLFAFLNSKRNQPSVPLCTPLLYPISLWIAFVFYSFNSIHLIQFVSQPSRKDHNLVSCFTVGDKESAIKAFREGLNNNPWDASSTFLSLALMAQKKCVDKIWFWVVRSMKYMHHKLVTKWVISYYLEKHKY